MSTKIESTPLSALADALARHRLLLFGLYVGLIGVCAAAIYGLSWIGAPDVFSYFVPGRDSKFDGEAALSDAIYFVIGLLSLQALFLFGGGRIPIGSNPVGIWRLLVPISIACAAGVLMLVTFAYTVLEIFDRADSEGSIREAGTFDFERFFEDNDYILFGLIIVWLVWIVLAAIVYQRHDHESVLRRLTNCLLAGSWIEFLVALPVDIAIRQRAESCPCATGSWAALLVSIPIIIFAFGPAMFLLYLREIELGRDSPRRATRILLHKSRRQGELRKDGRLE